MQQLKFFDQEGSVTKAVLKNDVTILVGEAHATPLAEILFWIKTGSRDDPPDLAGISRLMEHMLVRGTPTRTASAIAGDIKFMGGELHTSTGYDHTLFRTVVPAPQWKRALEIQADAVLNPLLDPDELKRQVRIVGDEIRRASADPEWQLENGLLATGFAGERLRRVPRPADASLDDITRDRLLAFHRSGYRTDRLLIVVCGDVTASDVLGAAVGFFAAARAAAPQGAGPAPAETARGLRYDQVRGRGASGRIALGFSTASAAAADLPALDVLRALLGIGEGSIFHRRLKRQKQLIDDVGARLVSCADGGYLTLFMELDARNFDRCEIAAFTEIEILKQMDPEIGELERARAQLKREFWEVTQSVSGRAERLARLESLGSWKSVTTYLERLQKVQWEDVRRVASRYLTLDHCALVEYLPTKSETRAVSADTIRGTIKDLLAAATRQEIEAREKLTVAALDVPKAAGAFTPADVRNSFQTASVLRGPELVIKEDHTMPLVHLGIFYAGGRLFETRANAGITSLLLHSMLGDSENKSAEQIFRQLEVYGASLAPYVADDYFGVHLSILSPYVEAGLGLLSEMIKSPKLDPRHIERQKALLQSALRNRTDGDRARRGLLEAVFRGHAYGLDPIGTEESLAGITPEAVQAWHGANIADKKPMVAMIGDTRGTSLAGFFVRNFSGSRFQDIAVPDKYAEAIEKRQILESKREDAASILMMGFQAPPEQDEDSYPLLVFLQHAAGLAGRLLGAISNRVSSIFDPSMEYAPRMKGGSATISLSTAAADEELAGQALVEEITRILTAPVSYRDYRSAANAAVAAVQIRRQDRRAQIADVIQSLLAGKGIAGFEEHLFRLQQVKQGDLQDVARRMLRTEKSVTLRVHGIPPS
jgi:zinc protease